ncbi:ATP-binding protein [Leptospira mtsangambouensis]|uniref:ATP-binding protein n=1 Tax=Leptospira mtsangambouensis TaxID=2484912 RepID=A0ABY2P5F4_9LEPT|nr:ATP-binding protein [Leptospira mtsangambouensis]
MDQLKEVLSSINEKGQHIVLFGERGVGKTSLSNIVRDIFNEHAIVSKITCSKDSTFNQLWDKTFREIVQKFEKKQIGFHKDTQTSSYNLNDLKTKDLHDIDSVTSILSNYDKTKFLLIFDEYDVIENPVIKTTYASLIKSLSDNNENVTIMLVGIGESINDLIGQHPSLERCLKQIYLQKMSNKEILEIITSGTKAMNIRMEEKVQESIVKFSDGFPHFTHLLSKYACEEAINENKDIITENHFQNSVKRATSNAHETIRNTYEQAIRTTKLESNFKDVLYSCAMATVDEHGTFRAKDLEEFMSKLLNKEVKLRSFTYHLGKLSQDTKGNVLIKVGTSKNHRYKFKNPMLKAYLKLKFFEEGHFQAE